MEASSKPEIAGFDIKSHEVRPSNLRHVETSDGQTDIERDVSRQVSAAAEAAFLKRMDYRMVPLLFSLCKSASSNITYK